jgi:DNA-binding winged helix-turn-helix (wHTH) protein/Tol biopolymer transport system component
MSATTQPEERIRFGEFELNLHTRELQKNGDRFDLQEQPFLVLTTLLEHSGELVSREELIKKLWPSDTFVDFEHSLNKAVKRLREALQDSAEEPRFIETLPRRGYRFIAPVVGVVIGNGAKLVPLVVATSTSNGEVRLAALLRKRVRAILTAVAFVVVVAVGLAVWRWTPPGRTPDLQKMQITKITDNGEGAQVAISPDGKYVAYERVEGEKISLWLHQIATRSEVQIIPPGGTYVLGLTFSVDGNYLYFIGTDKDDPFLHHVYMMPVLGGPARLLIRNVDTPVSFSPDGRKFVFTRGVPTRAVVEVGIANADGTDERLLATMKDSSSDAHAAAGATWSPDGRTICVPLRQKQKPGVLEVVSVADGSTRELYASSSSVGRALWEPEGDLLVAELEDQWGRGQLWTISYPLGKRRRLTNDLFDYATKTDMTRDGKTVATLAMTQVSSIWTAPASELSSFQQVGSGNLPMVEVAGAADGRLLSISRDGEPWIMNADGSQRLAITNAHRARGVAACGRFVVFVSTQAATDELIRADSDGSNPKLLVSGDLGAPACSPDGKFAFYLDLRQPRKISRVPLEGGAAVEIAKPLGEGSFGLVSVSPDGKFLAYSFDEGIDEPVIRLAVIPIDGGPPAKVIKGLAGLVRWSPDGKGLDYLKNRNGAANIWEQPLAGGAAKQLTNFTSDRIFNFNWSSDYKRLLLTRGNFNSDVVLVSNFR